MIVNLFSIFDPSSSFLIRNWIALTLFFLVLLNGFWVKSFNFLIFLKKIVNILYLEFKTLLGPFSGVFTLFIISLFVLVVCNNFFGLFSYVFNSTRHIVITLSIAFPLWLLLIIFGWLNQSIYIFAHLVPQRTPIALISFMVLIESIRRLIRPITLSVRLIANIVAGHLLITLLGNLAVNASFYLVGLTLLIQFGLLTLELAVSFIQSYVFSVLITLYTREILNH